MEDIKVYTYVMELVDDVVSAAASFNGHNYTVLIQKREQLTEAVNEVCRGRNIRDFPKLSKHFSG